MKSGLTELVFILDRSGSMGGLESDTIGGFNAMLAKQKKIDGECFITTMLFDSDFELLHDRIDIKAVSPMIESDYSVGGTTALLDAIGSAIAKVERARSHTAEDYRAENVMFVIITDGEENSSREYSSKKVKTMIENHKEKDKWEFVFLGANIDAVQTASRFGIDANRAQNYHADRKGVKLNFSAISDAVASYRECSSMPTEWNEKIREDFDSRTDKHKK